MSGRSIIANVAGALALAFGTSFSGQAPSAPVFLPDTAAVSNAVLEGSTWTEVGPDFAIRLQQIDAAQRLAYIEHTTGVAIDPFASPPGKLAGFLTFVLEIENRGDGDISFNPQTCWMIPSRKKELQAPFGINDLSFAYSITGRDLPTAYRRTAPAVFDEARTVLPGQSISGLLIYKSLPTRTRSLRVDAVLSLPTGDIVRFSAPYRRSSGPS